MFTLRPYFFSTLPIILKANRISLPFKEQFSDTIMNMKEKIADYLLDISKLVFAGVVLSGIFQIDGVSQAAVLLSGISVTIIFALIGFVLLKE